MREIHRWYTEVEMALKTLRLRGAYNGNANPRSSLRAQSSFPRHLLFYCPSDHGHDPTTAASGGIARPMSKQVIPALPPTDQWSLPEPDQSRHRILQWLQQSPVPVKTKTQQTIRRGKALSRAMGTHKVVAPSGERLYHCHLVPKGPVC